MFIVHLMRVLWIFVGGALYWLTPKAIERAIPVRWRMAFAWSMLAGVESADALCGGTVRPETLRLAAALRGAMAIIRASEADPR